MGRLEDTKEKLIQEVQALAKQLGRTPKKREFKNHPSACWHFGTWNTFIMKAGLLPMKEINLSLKDYENIIHNFVKDKGKTPTMRDFNNDKYLPDSTTIVKQFGKPWNELLVDLGYQPNFISNDFSNVTDQELLKIVKEELQRIGGTTIVAYQDNRKNTSPSVKYLSKRLGLKWNEILKKIGVELNVEIKTKEERINVLKKLAKELGRTPSMSDLEKHGISPGVYKFHFQSWNNAIKLAGLETNVDMVDVTHTNEELLNMYINLCQRLGKAATSKDIDEHLQYKSDIFSIRFNGVNNLREIAGYEKIKYTRKYSKNEIIKKLLKEYNKIGRKLTNKEIMRLSKENDNFPSASTICRYFSTTKMSDVWKEILD